RAVDRNAGKPASCRRPSRVAVLSSSTRRRDWLANPFAGPWLLVPGFRRGNEKPRTRDPEPLLHPRAAVDPQDLAGHEAGIVAGQVQRRLADVVRLAGTAERNAAGQRIAIELDHPFPHVAHHEA